MLTLLRRLVQTATARNRWRSQVCLDLPCHNSKVELAIEEKKEGWQEEKGIGEGRGEGRGKGRGKGRGDGRGRGREGKGEGRGEVVCKAVPLSGAITDLDV